MQALRVVGLLLALGVVGAVPQKLTSENANEVVGLSRFEAMAMYLARVGKYELAFNVTDVRSFLQAAHPFTGYKETEKNVVLMDEFPYYPVVSVPTDKGNVSVVLSNLELVQDVDEEMVKVEFDPGWQSLLFLDIPMNATFDWRVNDTEVSGKARVHVPHSWVHQNVEIACVRETTSALAWEGRIDLYPTDVDISTTSSDKDFVGKLANAFHSGKIVKKYIANAMQHQISSFVGKTHWRLQGVMDDLCLNCEVMRSSNTTITTVLRGNPTCLKNVPPFVWRQVRDENATPGDLQSIAATAVLDALEQSKVKEASAVEHLQAQTLVQGKKVEIDQLHPRVDPRARFRKSKAPGFIESPTMFAPLRERVSALWAQLRGEQPPTTTQDKKVEDTA